MKTIEANIDGIVGPSHNYAGLSFGNVASETYARSVSNPREAALQGLHKMKFLHDLGVPQLVMPPQLRPHMRILQSLGFASLDAVPQEVLYPLYSASSMWVANAATISPSADTKDGKVHVTPANLISKFHRSVETETTANYLKQILPGTHFVHHAPLPAHTMFADEGAANHMRLCHAHGEKGMEIFVYGGNSKRFPARQSRAAAEAIIRLHGLEERRTVLLEQHPDAIDAGVFHNDVIAMSNERLFIYHEKAYTHAVTLSDDFRSVIIHEGDLSLAEAVSSYFFNSQLVTLPNGKNTIIAPKECEEHPKAKACFEALIADGHIGSVRYLDVRESMKNGGGPACLRLRLVLTEEEQRAVHPGVWLNDSLYLSLCRWIENNYRDKITPDDLRDPHLATECGEALQSLQTILKIQLGAA